MKEHNRNSSLTLRERNHLPNINHCQRKSSKIVPRRSNFCPLKWKTQTLKLNPSLVKTTKQKKNKTGNKQTLLLSQNLKKKTKWKGNQNGAKSYGNVLNLITWHIKQKIFNPILKNTREKKHMASKWNKKNVNNLKNLSFEKTPFINTSIPFTLV